jgi:hypothetical protein
MRLSGCVTGVAPTFTYRERPARGHPHLWSGCCGVDVVVPGPLGGIYVAVLCGATSGPSGGRLRLSVTGAGWEVRSGWEV